MQRKGNVITRVLETITAKDAQVFVREIVSNKASLLATDESRAYNGLMEYPRVAVEHQKHQYAVGAVHTKAIEGFWSIINRGVAGTFHKMNAEYMPLYVAGFQFRCNNCANADIFGAVVNKC